ncbi:MotA/TolQ/ExbB proton channel family protein [Massilia sp. IC2-477]|uniref:MotA/TolQ/ExbB proton channel family protein n=1 Tax=unclassified Massilia TaxID=2609279 RepID=UPI001D1024F8|nr:MULTISPECIES: MotA/TolQ/ExbB proton channel family protein [unclassified Massilia]MCC2958461.1 MotA/TolQ/ExbB proton channel family protein [Massilia sp. IC2-477]MCC2974745.1 MotA/TolQ/ExbB proton channel family protein [Massilia sp. IC2-476]
MLRTILALSALLGTASTAHAAEINLIEQLQEGGAAIVVTLGLSVLFVAVSIERLLHLRTSAVVPRGLAENARALSASLDTATLQATAQESNSTLGRIIAYMLAHRGQSHAWVSSGAGDIASLELRHHQQKFYALSIVATVAPIVGLLGTVLGMIDSFNVIAYAEGMGNPALLAGGISKALINTAAGLAVALPALGMHHFFKHRLAVLSLELEKQVNGLLHEWFAPAAVAGAPSLQVVQHAH